MINYKSNKRATGSWDCRAALAMTDNENNCGLEEKRLLKAIHNKNML